MWWRIITAQQKLNIPLPKYLYDILRIIHDQGGNALVVGGAVRDALMGVQPKDIDIEVYRLSYDDLLNILKKFGKADIVGKSFGVIKFMGQDGADFDFSLPRIDSKAGVGHKDFNVQISSDLTPQEAAARRDFTVNAISWDPLTQEIIDPFNGVEDLNNKILRHTSPAFTEDPLRALRGCQFCARFGFDLAPETAKLIRSIRDQYQYLPKERVEAEFKKLVTKGKYPGNALEYLHETGWDELFPEIKNMFGVRQEPEWHPEIWLQDHVKYVMNEAARIADENHLTPDEREVLIYAALAHDFAKPQTTKIINKKGVDRITSHGHEEQGMPLAESFLKSIGVNQKVINQVKPLVGYHLAHIHFSNSGSTDAFIKNLAEKIHPSNIKMLTHLMEADHSGRPPLPKELPPQAKEMYNRAQEIGVHLNKLPDLIRGADIIAYTGIPGPYIGKILAEARALMLNNSSEMQNRETALMWLDKKMKNVVGLINGNDVIEHTTARGAQISHILNQAWEAQKQKIFSDKPQAISWLKNNFSN